MPNGQHSKASRDLAYVKEQLRTGKTRSGRELSSEDLEVLQEKANTLKQGIEDLRVSRITSHTTNEQNRGIQATEQAAKDTQEVVREATRHSDTYYKAVGGAGSSADHRIKKSRAVCENQDCGEEREGSSLRSLRCHWGTWEPGHLS